MKGSGMDRNDNDLVGGMRLGAEHVDKSWALLRDKQGCFHVAPLFGADHWADRCPCRPVIETDGVIVHKEEN